MGFTAHNIRLDDGTQTFPAAGFLIEEGTRFQAAKRMLKLVFGGGLRGKRIADLGCLEGGYATGFARLGMDATGIEVRDSNFQNCLYVRSKVDLTNLTFVKDNVENIEEYGIFDAVWACGILYHLENPASFLKKVARSCGRVILIETHFTYADRTPAADHHKLSDICEHEGLRGRWYMEYEEGLQTKSEELKWSSWSNRRSFWIEKEYLLNFLKEIGFDIVLEQYDSMSNILQGMANYYRFLDRSLFVGIKSP